MRHPWVAVFWALLALPAVLPLRSLAAPDAPADYARMVEDFHQKNLLDLQQHYPFTIVMAWTPAQRNAVALLAAQTLTVPDGSDTLPNYSAWKEFVATRWHNHTSLPYGMKFYSVALLRDLSGRRGVTTPQVIPPLLHALRHPDRYSIGQPAFGALVSLTGHRIGERDWGQLVDDAALRRTSAWWSGWWDTARAKHPVFDAATEAQARRETLAVARRIEAQVKPQFSELGAFAVSPESIIQYSAPPRAPGTFVDIAYDTSFLQGFDGPGPMPRDCRLHIWSHFVTPDMPDDGPRAAPAFARESDMGKMESVFYSVLPGTDIAVEVQIATHDRALVQTMRRVLSPLGGGPHSGGTHR